MVSEMWGHFVLFAFIFLNSFLGMFELRVKNYSEKRK
jgi:hypothetical protein